ncbi:Serpin-5, partial [Operophtera brumata]
MLSTGIFLFLVGSCFCATDFAERPRNFSIELLYHTQAETGGHVVISPFGIWTLMTGVALGATGNSYRQLASAFILPSNENYLIKGFTDLTSHVLESRETSGVSLTSMNFLFLANDFQVNSQFRNLVQNDFQASIKVLNFDDPNSADDANSFIEKSGAKVSNVLHSEDFQQSRMILTNVISFKGLWSSPFNKTDTQREPFYNENKEVIGSVNMMFQKGQFPFANMKNLKAYVVELPYGTGGKYSMLFVLPYANVKIADMYRNFATVTLKDIFDKLEANENTYGLNDVDVKIPRFHISTNVVLNKPLNKMGVNDIFQPDLATFHKVTQQNIFVSAIVHKADIEVTESGTIASAASTATFSDRISAPSFYCNRPFVYFVMEKTTTTVIFGGIYSEPTIANSYIEKSGGRVSNVLRSDDFQESRMILTNVISFKGLWALPFNTTDTQLEPFYNEDKVVIGNVNMMFQKGQFPFANMKNLKAFVVELPYGTGGKYSMLFVLPYANVKIADMYRNFATVTLKDIFDKLEANENTYGLDDVDVKIPRFHISTNVVLNKPLNKMGVYDIFQPDLASFHGVTQQNIFVSAIVHKADIEITESGTIASAVSTATFSDRISAPSFYCNRPFAYFVMEKTTTTVIFSGIYSQPTVY